jgi:hypothetical protein
MSTTLVVLMAVFIFTILRLRTIGWPTLKLFSKLRNSVIYFNVEFLFTWLPVSLKFIGPNHKIPHRCHVYNFNIVNFLSSSLDRTLY